MRKLTQHDQKVFMMMNDPTNVTMNKIRYGGTETLEEAYKEAIQASIQQKKAASLNQPDSENVFLNSLNEQEYVEFVNSRKSSRYLSSGIKTETLAMTGKKFETDNVLNEEEENDHFSLDEIREQFKVFRDPTF